MYIYLKALHIIFIVTWFSGMFYIVRLFIYNTEANEKSEPEKKNITEAIYYYDKTPVARYHMAISNYHAHTRPSTLVSDTSF
mgnify:CR=1 FL=1